MSPIGSQIIAIPFDTRYKKIMSMTVSTARKARLHLFRRTGSRWVVCYPRRELGRHSVQSSKRAFPDMIVEEIRFGWPITSILVVHRNLIFPFFQSRRGTVAGPRFGRFIRGEDMTNRTRLAFPVDPHTSTPNRLHLRHHPTPRVPLSRTYSRKTGGKQRILIPHNSFKRPRFVEQNYPT